MKTVLLVDDEQRMLDLLSLYISPHGYECIKISSGRDAVGFLKNNHADLVILDIMMPEMDGWKVCGEIRKFSRVPIIMLTARDEGEDIVKGLKLGADDYVTKPFNEDELLARMEAVMRRVHLPSSASGPPQGIVMDENAFVAHYKSQTINLTPKEFAILGLLLKHPNKVFSRDHIISSLWNFETDTEDRTVDSHIRNIREKLRQADFPVDGHLKTVWGVGYKWSDEG